MQVSDQHDSLWPAAFALCFGCWNLLIGVCADACTYACPLDELPFDWMVGWGVGAVCWSGEVRCAGTGMSR